MVPGGPESSVDSGLEPLGPFPGGRAGGSSGSHALPPAPPHGTSSFTEGTRRSGDRAPGSPDTFPQVLDVRKHSSRGDPPPLRRPCSGRRTARSAPLGPGGFSFWSFLYLLHQIKPAEVGGSPASPALLSWAPWAPHPESPTTQVFPAALPGLFLLHLTSEETRARSGSSRQSLRCPESVRPAAWGCGSLPSFDRNRLLQGPNIYIVTRAQTLAQTVTLAAVYSGLLGSVTSAKSGPPNGGGGERGR